MAAHLLRNIPALLYFTDCWSGNPAFSRITAHSTLKQQSLCACCPLLPDNVAGRRFVVQLAQNNSDHFVRGLLLLCGVIIALCNVCFPANFAAF